MQIGIVIGNVWATRKEETLNGLKLMVVQRLDLASGKLAESYVAVDCVGAGRGERVLITTGSSARKALRDRDTPVDAAIVGILDQEEMMGKDAGE
ncbi:MAG: EutN/CcmL family microcompartment protein [Desulfovibrio sp.]|jgi:ethanolamine utilization protein EutN|nr:EutN/CcmL family microcompartment protein [Desulfovibrio sp.]